MTQADAYSSSHGADQDHTHGHDEPHVLPLTTYFAVWGALVVLTAITVAVSRFDFGSANTIIAMFVATVKATLVALFFMHLLYDNKLNLIILVASMMFVSIFFTPVLIDLSSRGALDLVKTRAGYRAITVPPVEPTSPPAEAQEGAEPAAAGAQGAAAGDHAAAGAKGAATGDHGAAASPGAPTAGTTASANAGPTGKQAPAGGAAAGGQPGAAVSPVALPSGQAAAKGGLPSPAKNQPDPGPGQPSVSQPNAQQPGGAPPNAQQPAHK